MVIKAYLVQSHQTASISLGAPDPIWVGTVQFTGGIDEGRSDSQRKKAAIAVLRDHSPLVYDRIIGYGTWRAELANIDDESLGPPSFEDAEKGYRVWLSIGPSSK